MAEINPHTLLIRDLQARMTPERIAKGLADRWGLPSIDFTSRAMSRTEFLFQELNIKERVMIASVLQIDVSALDHKKFAEFLSMHPGVRDLRMQLVVADGWQRQDWRDAIQDGRAAIRSIYQKCDLVPASPPKRLEALAIERAFTAPILDSFVLPSMVPLEPISPRYRVLTALCDNEHASKLEVFNAWLEGNDRALRDFWQRSYPSANDFTSVSNVISGKTKLDDRTTATIRWMERVHGTQILFPGKKGKGLLVDVTAGNTAYRAIVAKYNATCDLWFNTPPHERFQYYDRNVLCLSTVASLANKIRFHNRPAFTREETGLVSLLVSAPVVNGIYVRADLGLQTSLDDSYMASRELAGQLTEKLEQIFIRPACSKTGGGRTNYYQQAMLDVAAFGETMQLQSLYQTAHREARFNVLTSFLGFNHQVLGSLAYDSTSMKAKRALDGTPKECEDNFSSAVISLPDGKTIRLDAVFDGMGGHGGGRRASEIAKEVFEVAAVAGWIRTPEDVRAVIITMDVAIVMDQVESKKSLDQPYHTNAMQTNSMGTTATIAYQKGDEFYGIHCGDSDWKIHRGDQVVAEGVGHSGIYTTFFKEVLREYEQKGLTLRTLNAAQATEFYAEVIRRANEVSFPANYIGSALGHGASHIHINNVVFGFEPVRLQKGDIVRVNSDGVGVPICDHEVSYVLGMYHGDLEMTRDALIAMAEERRIDNRKGPIMRDAQGLVIRDEDGNPQHEAITEFDTLCSCKRRKSKIDDDKTIMLRRV